MTTADPPQRRGVSVVRPIEAAKDAVRVEELAERLSGAGHRRGREMAYICPLHDDHDPSLQVDPEGQRWYCFPCGVGGDVVRLAQLAWKIERPHVAAAELLLEFGHPLPERPPAWFRKQERQRTARERIDAERVEHVRLLVFRLVFAPWLRRLPEWVLEEAAESAWETSRSIALRLYEQRRGA